MSSLRMIRKFTGGCAIAMVLTDNIDLRRGSLRALRLGWASTASLVSLSVAVPALAQDAADAAVADTAQSEFRFDVMEYVVRGNTVLGAADIQTALMPFAGYDKTVPDVDAARAALEQVYRERGYATVVVEVPQQDVSSGLVS